MTLAEAAVLLAAVGWAAVFAVVTRAGPALPPEPYAACSGKSSGQACRADYRSAGLEGSCLRQAGSALYCHPRTVKARDPQPAGHPAAAEPAERHASR